MVQEILLSLQEPWWSGKGKPKRVGSEVMLQTIEANLASSTQRVSGELSISRSGVILHLYNIGKKHLVLLNCGSKYCKIFNSSKYIIIKISNW